MNMVETLAAQMRGAMRNVPHGRVLTLRYCTVPSPQQAQVPATKGPQPGMGGDGLEVTIRAPDGDVYEHYLPNGKWNPANPSAQMMALVDTPPSEFDGQRVDIRDEDILVPLAVDGDGNYHIHQNALEQGAEALQSAEWMDTSSVEEAADADAQADAEDLSNDVVDVDVGNQEGEDNG